ncbi:MAG: AMP-binding protein [Nocardioides sp.]
MSGTAAEVLALLRSWEAAPTEPEPLVLETSGSTGLPKRVRLSRAAMRASAAATSARLGGPGQWLLGLPPTYVAGLQVLFRSVVAGTEPVMQDGDLAAAMTSMTGERRYVSLVPTQLHRILQDPAQARLLGTFTNVLVGGAHIPADLRALSAEQRVRVVATYGTSETCGGCVYDGVPLDGVSVAVDADGRVRLAGPVLFDGYDGRPDLTEEVVRDGWFLTEDLGRLDEDGKLQVLGRIDDVVVSGGVNVPTSTVAARLQEHVAVTAAAVVGVPDPEWGHRVVAFVVGELDLDAARDWVDEVQPRSWAPRELFRLATIPLLSNGKVDRVRLQRVARG